MVILVQLKDQVTKQPNMIPENQKVAHSFNTTVTYLCLGSCTVVPCWYTPDITTNRCEIKINIYHHTFYASPKKFEMIRSIQFVQTMKYTQHEHYRNQAITIIQKCTKVVQVSFANINLRLLLQKTTIFTVFLPKTASIF